MMKKKKLKNHNKLGIFCYCSVLQCTERMVGSSYCAKHFEHTAIRVRYRKRFYRQNREKVKAARRAYYQSHKPESMANNAARRAALLRATPKWSEKAEITEFFRNRPAGYEVDHIYPLRGQSVSGLHVLANLQYLPKRENRRKRNKIPA